MRKFYALMGICVLGAIMAGTAEADPCLVVYPVDPCIYHYDPNEYYTVEPGHPLYDLEYDRGGRVLLDINTDEVDESIYQAPNLIGFTPSIDEKDGYFFEGMEFTLIVDGFSNEPTTFVNVLIVFDQPNPSDCTPEIVIDGVPLEGNVYEAGDLVVSTPTQSGNNYSDTMSFEVEWDGCFGLRIWSFSDENYNGQKEGGECFTAFSHDVEIHTENSSWGEVKSIYR